ncbi:MAG: NnrU family protein [Pseudomonadota bacterium]
MLYLAGLSLVLATHSLTAFAPAVRDTLVRRLGKPVYVAGYSAISLFGLGLLVVGWARFQNVQIYHPPFWMRHVTYGLMFAALLCLAATVLPEGHVKRTLKYPAVVAVIFWGAAHLFANGDLRSLLLFGVFLVYSVLDRVRKGFGPQLQPSPEGAAPYSPPKLRFDIAAGILAGVGWLAIYFALHPYIAGVSLR